MRRYLALILVLMLLVLSGCEGKKPVLRFDDTDFTVYVGEEIELVPQVKNFNGEFVIKYTITPEGILQQHEENKNKFVALVDGEATVVAELEGYDVKVTVTVKVIKLHKITYHLDGGTLTDKVEEFKASDLPITLNEPTKSGYRFLGWYLESSYENKITQLTEAKDYTLYAKWEELPPQEYTITYELNGGTIQNPKTTFTEDDLPLTLPTPTKEGFTFVGWYLKADFSGDSVTQITDANNVTVYAKWIETEYTITYELNGGTLESPKTKFTISELPLTLPTPTKEDYTFAGWYLTSDFSGNPVTQLTEAKNVTLYAKWEAIQYTITYELNGGTLTNAPTKFTKDQLPLTLPTPTKEGKEFAGWYLTSDFSGNKVTAITTKGNVTVYAKWEDPVDTSKVYVGKDVAGKEYGSIILYSNTYFIVGRTAFETFGQALNVTTGKIIVGPGEYTESFTISKSNIEISGPGKNVPLDIPAEQLTEQEAVMKGTITLANNLKGITIRGLYFTGSAKIKSTGKIETFKFIENKVIDTDEATSTWALLRENVPAFLSLYNEDTNISNISKDIEISNNYFINVSEYNVSIARVENVLIAYNQFKNFNRDAIRLDGGYNGGKFTVQYNIFENDIRQGYNGIYLRIYGGDGVYLSRHTIEIYYNTFKNIGQDQEFSGAISARNYNEKGAKIDIKYNYFENCINYLSLRNNATAENHTQYKWIADINHNGFFGIPQKFYFTNVSGIDNTTTNPPLANFDKNYFEDNNGNPITDLTSYQAKIVNVASNKDHYQSRSSFENYVNEQKNKTPTAIQIKNPVDKLNIYDTYQLNVIVLPDGVDQRVSYSSSDTTIAIVSPEGLITALKEGTVIITLNSTIRPTVVVTLEITVIRPASIEVSYEGSGVLAVGEKLDISYTLLNVPGNDTIIWSSSNETILTVDQNGRVTAVAPGNASITLKGTQSNLETTIGLTVYNDSEIDPLLKLLAINNRGRLFTRVIGYYGSEVYYNRIYNSVNRFLPEPLEIEELLLPTSKANHPNRKKDSIEYITVHDTGNSGAGSTARANGNYMLSSSGEQAGVSWHYTVGNDGIFKHMDEDQVAWHAGDGGTYIKFDKYDTGVKATVLRPKVSISGGYLYFNGIKSNIQVPSGGTRINDEGGLLVFIGSNGNYYVGPLWSNNGVVVNRGGNYNAVGIETAVNNGSDVYYTWLRTAKLVADIMVRNNLTMSQVGFHRHFSNKMCPQTMIRANLQEEFLSLVELAYIIRKDYNDYTIEFVSHSPTIIDNNGRVINPPAKTTNVQYTITIKKGNFSQSITLNALVPGQYTW